MANEKNYVTDIRTNSQQYTRFSVSRIVNSSSSNLIDMEVPAEFPLDIPDANIELAIYSMEDNSLVFIYSIKNENNNDIITTKTIQYNDNTLRKFVLIDFQKIKDVYFPVGTYSITLSFLVNELGSLEVPPLRITNISPSRTEVELELLDATQQNKMINLVTPKITQNWITQVLAQIFNQSLEGDIPPVSPVGIDSGSLQFVFGETLTNKIKTYGFDVDVNERPGVYTVAQKTLDIAYPIAYKYVTEYLTKGNTFIDKETLLSVVDEALDEAFESVYRDAETNPEKYRYNIL